MLRRYLTRSPRSSRSVFWGRLRRLVFVVRPERQSREHSADARRAGARRCEAAESRKAKVAELRHCAAETSVFHVGDCHEVGTIGTSVNEAFRCALHI